MAFHFRLGLQFLFYFWFPNIYISPSLYPGCQIISPVLDHFLFCGVHFQFSGSTQNSAHNSPLAFPTQGQGTDRQLQPPQTSVVVKGGRGHHLRKSAKGRQQWLRPWRCQGEAATAVDLIKSPGSTRGNTCVTPRSKSRYSSASTSIAPSQAPHAASSCCGSVPYLPTLSQSRSRFGFRTEGQPPITYCFHSLHYNYGVGLPLVFFCFSQLCLPVSLYIDAVISSARNPLGFRLSTES